MAMERQTSWGGLVVTYMYLGGTGAGIYTAGFIAGLTGGFNLFATTSMMLGPVAVILGMICLLVEAGTPLQTYRLLQGLPTSWMSRGGLAQILFILFGLGFSLPGLWISGWLSSGSGMTLGIIGLVLALALAIYHGIVLAEMKRVPLWSSSVLPPLSLFMALCTGMGLLMLTSVAYDGVQVEKVAGILGIAGTVFVIAELITICLLIGDRSNAVRAESVRRIKIPIIISVVCLVLTLPLLGIVIAGANYSVILPISGVLLLAGGYLTRYSILRGGYYIPLRIPETLPVSGSALDRK